MFASRYALARTATALATTSIRLAPSTRKPRRKRKNGKGGLRDERQDGTVDAAVEEVERLLAETATAAPPSTAGGSSGLKKESNAALRFPAGVGDGEGNKTSATLSLLSSSAPPPQAKTAAAAAAAAATLDSASALHFRAVHHATDFTSLEQTTTRGGPTHAQLEQIERRRSKLSIAEAESEVGVTERLVPELPRLPALHEVHYGDAVVREVDRSQYFAAHPHHPQHTTPSAVAETRNGDQKQLGRTDPQQASSAATVMIGNEAYVELSLDGDLSEVDFAAFDAEAATQTGAAAAAATTTAQGDGSTTEKKAEEFPEQQQQQLKNGEEAATVAQDLSVVRSNRESTAPVVEDGHDVEAHDGEDDAVAVPLVFGTARPWFVPPSGVVELEPLSPHDCALLLRFLLYLRQQTEADLVPTVRRALQHAEAANRATGDAEGGAAGIKRSGGGRHVLTLGDVVRYLDTAPPPVIGFTESLPSPSSIHAFSSDAAGTSGTARFPAAAEAAATPSPAFVFHLYLENVSSQNAIGHLATLFGLPQRCFQPHSAVSKMSCSTVLCAVGENRLRREHLLLLNTLRHPGFVLRVSTIQEVSPARYAAPANVKPDAGELTTARGVHRGADAATLSVTQQLFGEIARWQPLYEVELLLRRVCSDSVTSGHNTRQQLEHRLRAVQTLGAICFCANREASLARAATDVLHGFFKSALLNALQRRKSPMPMQRFLKRPNVATAQHAHHVSTDPTVRQVLKTFVQTNGDWQVTVVRAPYVWRRRWINALRGVVWNTMASQRLRQRGREVCLGDVVLRPEFRADVQRRGIITVKAEHVMTVTTLAEAAAASLADVFIPFLRGRFPEHLFADDSTQHPIMTRANMLALLRSMHAPQLLLGMSDELRQLLDVRAESSPMLFRRLIVRPVAMEFAILEDKPPMKALHYDAARLLSNDRWAAAAAATTTTKAVVNAPLPSPPPPPSDKTALSPAPASGASHLIPPSAVLERTTLGARLTSGVLAEEFFAVPSPEDYVVLGHAHRHLAGGFVAAAPHSNTADVGDRVYTVYIRAVVEYNVSGLSSVLREYFLLSGIETESESALQHKVHRMRRELDPETALLTAPVYCTTCFNRDHDTQEQCAEYQFKVHRRAAQMDVAAVAVAVADRAKASLTDRSGAEQGVVASPAQTPTPSAAMMDTMGAGPATSLAVQRSTAPSTRTVRMRWRLRRRNDEQRWGVHLTKSLQLVGLENAQLFREGAVWSTTDASTVGQTTMATQEDNAKDGDAQSLPVAAQSSPWPASWLTEAADAAHERPLQDRADDDAQRRAQTPSTSSPSHGVVQFLRAVFQPTPTTTKTSAGASAPPMPSESLQDLLFQSPVLPLPTDLAVLQLQPKEATPSSSSAKKTGMAGPAVLKACPWTLTLVNATAVSTQRDVAAALLQQTAKAREVWLTFELHVREETTASVDAGADGVVEEAVGGGANARRPASAVLSDALLHSTHAADRIPQSTAALSPQRRHEVEAAMRAAVQATSPTTQRWLQDLPYRLTLVLVKHRRHLRKHRSWGLQLDGTDMTLVNFARLMVQYMYVSAAPDKRLRIEHAIVHSLTPAASFPRNDAATTARLFDEVLPRLEPLLNDAYRVVRINTTAVHHKAEAARAMVAFQTSVDAEMATRGRGTSDDVDGNGADASGQFYLTLTLERKGSSYRMCTALDSAAGAGEPHASATATSAAPPTNASRFSRRRMTGMEAEAAGERPAATPTPAPTPTVEVDGALLEGLATPQCAVRPYTAAQLSRSSVTLAINRLLLTDQTRDKWGVRLQHGTRRLKAVQQNRYFSFHVFAAKQSQGTRIADTLRLVSTRRAAPQQHPPSNGDADGAESTREGESGFSSSSSSPAVVSSTAAHVITRSFYLYFVERVNQHTVRHHGELRAELLAAAQPAQTLTGLTSTVTITTLPPESVTLTVRQYPLLRFAATVRRGGVGEGSALAPVGLQVDKNMRVLAVVDGSPMAQALEAAVGPLCSVRRLVQTRQSIRSNRADPNGGAAVAAEASAAAGDGGVLRESEWDVVALPQLRSLVAKVAAVLSEPGSAAASPPKKQQQRQWAYDLDEDALGGAANTAAESGTRSSNNTCVDTQSVVTAESGKDGCTETTAALRELANAAAHTLLQLGRCTMVDGVHVLHASLVHEFAIAQLAALHASEQRPGDVHVALGTLQHQLNDVYAQVRWEVVYAAQSNTPLRTPADLAAAFAPGVAEETISIQQFVED